MFCLATGQVKLQEVLNDTDDPADKRDCRFRVYGKRDRRILRFGPECSSYQGPGGYRF